MPLKGVLKCYCGKNLTCAPSRGKMGKYYYYYRCIKTNHQNISANKAHDQMLQIQELMSIPTDRMNILLDEVDKHFETRMKDNKALLEIKKNELTQKSDKLYSIEEKWADNQITFDSYQRLYRKYNGEVISLKAEMDKLGEDKNVVYSIVKRNLDMLTDLRFVYERATVVQKQQMIRCEFAQNLYYQNRVFRTPTMLSILTHNVLEMKEKNLLIYEKNREDSSTFPFSGEGGIPIIVLIRYK